MVVVCGDDKFAPFHARERLRLSGVRGVQMAQVTRGTIAFARRPGCFVLVSQREQTKLDRFGFAQAKNDLLKFQTHHADRGRPPGHHNAQPMCFIRRGACLQ